MSTRRVTSLFSLLGISLLIGVLASGAILFSAQTKNAIYPELTAEASSNLTTTRHIVSDFARIALIEPTFTHAAYANSFYVFYGRHMHEPAGKKVTTDLPLLTAEVDPKAEQLSSHRFLSLVKNVETLLPNSKIQVLTDEEADAGAIFKRQAKNGDSNNHAINAFDILILGHQEYVTQKEYDNFKQFVQNGGRILFLDGNVFFAEVKYDRTNSTMTLVKGHGWEFNGKAAQVSVGERWKNETSQWVGSNYLCYLCTITFANNPFGYTHHEEQYLSNPKDVILLNYHASSDPTHTIATYELNYGKGKSVVVGLYSDDIIHNKKFIRFFDSLLLRQLQ